MIINPISKGGKGLLPEIIVTAPSGSTLDLMQNSVVLQTYTLSSTETQHTFIVRNTGTYTVRGISGSDTASVEVVVDAIGQYECELKNQFVIFDTGINPLNIATVNFDSTTGTSTVTSDYISLSSSYSSNMDWRGAAVKGTTPIDITGYKTAYISATISSTENYSSARNCFYCGFANSSKNNAYGGRNEASTWVNWWDWDTWSHVNSITNDVCYPLNVTTPMAAFAAYNCSSQQILMEIDLTQEAQGERYMIMNTTACGGSITVTIDKVWLE